VTPILEVDGVRLSYGPVEVLRGVSFAVAPGEAFAIIGPNGAGKTTLFKAISGEARCAAGAIRYRQQDITALPAHIRARRGLGRTFQMARIFPEFTVAENVIVVIEARLRAEATWRPSLRRTPSPAVVAEAEALLADIGLLDQGHVFADALSHGDKKRLEFAIALALRPTILLLDEPTAGMSLADRAGIVALIARIQRERGVTVILTEHDMDVIFNLASRVLVLNYGEILAIGGIEAVRADPAVRKAYLGEEFSYD
jgi:branched-chain amino acid transport system ATP-binding protein